MRLRRCWPRLRRQILLAQDSRIRLGRDAEPSRLEGTNRWSHNPSVEEAERLVGDKITGGVIERVLARLRELGMSDRDVTEVSHMLHDAMAQADGPNNMEMPEVVDEIPDNAIKAGRIGGKLAEKRGMASDAALRRIARRYPDLAAIAVDNFGTRAEPPRAPAPSRAVMARLSKRFPGIEGVIG